MKLPAYLLEDVLRHGIEVLEKHELIEATIDKWCDEYPGERFTIQVGPPTANIPDEDLAELLEELRPGSTR